MPFASVRIEDSMNINSNGVKPCCLYVYESPVMFKTVEEYLNSTELKKLQQHFLTEDTLPPGCKDCQEVEDANQLSIRQHKNKYFASKHLDKTNIQELDLFVSNVCNLSCIMCEPKFSSAVGAEHIKLGVIDQVYNFDQTDCVLDTIEKLDGLQYVHATGGEFFYSKHHKKILQAIIEKKIPKVKITTNGTIYNQETVDILKQIPDLSLRYSIDGVNDIYNFIRYPANWDSVQDNLLRFQKELPNAHHEIVTVVNPITLCGIYNWFEFANTHNFETHYLNIQGEMLGWEMLTDDERKTATEFLVKNIKKIQLTQRQTLTILSYAKSTLPNICYNSSVREFTIKRLTDLCRIRSVNKEKLLQLFEQWPNLSKEINERM